MKIIDCVQQSLEWNQHRCGVVTASEFDNLVTPEFKPRKGQMVETYLNRKVAEIWQGYPLPSATTAPMDIGSYVEGEAVNWYEFEFSETITKVGFITTDDGRIGCSPDGLIGREGGIEIKNPLAHTQVGYLRDGEVPKEYLAQVHGCMFVTGRPWWRFLSYRRGYPELVKLVERDNAIQDTLAEVLAGFVARIDEAIARLTEMNGGKRPEKPKTLLTPEPEDDGEIVP